MMHRSPLGVLCPKCGQEVVLETKSPNPSLKATIQTRAEFQGVPLICAECEQIFLYRRELKRRHTKSTRRCPACEHR